MGLYDVVLSFSIQINRIIELRPQKKYLPEGPGDDVVAEPNIYPGIKHMQ